MIESREKSHPVKNKKSTYMNLMSPDIFQKCQIKSNQMFLICFIIHIFTFKF